MYSGRERKNKPTNRKSTQSSGAALAAAAAADEEWGVKRKGSKRDKYLKTTLEDVDNEAPQLSGSGLGPSSQRRGLGAVNLYSLSEHVFMQWEELLGSREALKRRMNAISAVHGREGRRILLGGIEPNNLLESIKAEMKDLEPAGEALERADLLMELQEKRSLLESLTFERDSLAEDVSTLREECFEAKYQLEGQSDELDQLRKAAVEWEMQNTEVASQLSESLSEHIGSSGGGSLPSSLSSMNDLAEVDLDMFKIVLSRRQVHEGRQVIQALERLKLPVESSMSQRGLACWHENKKTIMNSLKTLSGQIYSATTRILYEIIQNADDCTFNDDGSLRELYIECSEDALVAYHNEQGFQPKDIYAMCQVGESSKAEGSGKIGRKGIGFKSVFQLTQAPIIISPPFQFCFDTGKHGVFGYIVPSWVEDPVKNVAPKHHALLRRVLPNLPGAQSPTETGTGTLLVCPKLPRLRSLDLTRDLQFDGLSLAFLKNLQQITFASSMGAPALSGARESKAPPSPTTPEEAESSTRRQYRVECTAVFERGGLGQEAVDLSNSVLQNVVVLSHRLFECTIIETVSGFAGGRETSHETRKYYRLHEYTVQKYRLTKSEPKHNTQEVVPSPSASSPSMATTTISLAFPLADDLSPLRSQDGELVFAYLPVTSVGFSFAIHADFELVASRQDVSDSVDGNHVILGRIPPLFVHAVLTDPALGEDAFPTYLPDMDTVRKDRSGGGGRKWHTLASALHRETGAYMMIPTESPPERVRRRNAVLRPQHLPPSLVPNSLLKAVSGQDKHFAHPEAVKTMGLESCLDNCPVPLIIECIRAVLNGTSYTAKNDSSGDLREAEESWSEEVQNIGAKKKGKIKGNKKKNRGDDSASSDLNLDRVDEVLLDVWRYFAGEFAFGSDKQSGEQGKVSLRLLVDALIGNSSEPTSAPPLRIFPVRGSSRLRFLCEHGAPLCLGISKNIKNQGNAVLRLLGNIVPFVDLEKMKGIDGLGELMHFIGVSEATELELQQQLKFCFRFGLATTVNPQLWWDSFRYTVTLGYGHGLVDFLPTNHALALPVVNSARRIGTDRGSGGGGGSAKTNHVAFGESCRVVSSRDVHALSVALPCFLGLMRDPLSSKYVVAVPPSAMATWGARVRWECSMVEALGVAFPTADAERLRPHGFAAELFVCVADARERGDAATLEALSTLVGIYESRMGAFLCTFRTAVESSSHSAVDVLLDTRASAQSFALSSCSPQYIDELMQWSNIKVADLSFHDTRALLEDNLGMLRLKDTGDMEHVANAPAESNEVATPPTHDEEQVFWDLLNKVENSEAKAIYDNFERTGDWTSFQTQLKAFMASYPLSEDSGIEIEGVLDQENGEEEGTVGKDEVEDESGRESFEENRCDNAIWSVLKGLLGFRHSFDPSECSWLLYSMLTPALAVTCNDDDQGDGFFDAFDSDTEESSETTTVAAACNVPPRVECLVTKLACSSLFFETDTTSLWTLISNAGGVWLGAKFVSLEQCIWEGGGSEIGAVLQETGCPVGPIVDVASEWRNLFQKEGCTVHVDFDLHALRDSFLKGTSGHPSLPHPTALEMMLNNVLPWLLKRDMQMGGLGPDGQWPSETMACYNAVVRSEFPPGRRWEVPVPSASLGICLIVVDRAFNPLLDREAEKLVVLPGGARFPFSDRFVLKHFKDDSLHPALAPLFAPLSERQSVGLEPPVAKLRRNLKLCLRLMAADVLAGAAAAESARSVEIGSLVVQWDLVGELYGRSTPLLVTSGNGIPPEISDADNWEFLLMVVIECAKMWHQMRTTGTPEDAGRYQEMVSHVRRLVPFCTLRNGGTQWSFLSERHPAHSPRGGGEGATPTQQAAPLLLLRTLFGFNLWGNLDGLELQDNTPSFTAEIPSSILLFSRSDTSPPSAALPSTYSPSSFPQGYPRRTLVLLWEWFSLEVAGAAPPSLLWSHLQEPIAAWSRPRIRAAEASLRVGTLLGDSTSTLTAALLESVLEHTQVSTLLAEMDASDAARLEAAQSALEARRRAEEEATERRREATLEARRLRQEEEARRRDARRGQQEERTAGARLRRQEQREEQDTLDLLRQQERAEQHVLNRFHEQQERDGDIRLRRQQEQAHADLARGGGGGGGGAMGAETVSSALDHLEGIVDPLRRLFSGGLLPGGGGGGWRGGSQQNHPRTHTQGSMMRESQVKGKLARFLAGMRAYVRSQEQLQVAAEASVGGRGGSAGREGSGGGGGAPLPPVLTEFVVWAGDFLAGEQSNNSANSQRQRNNDQHLQSAASKYLGGAANPRRGPSTNGAAESQPPAEAGSLKSKPEDCCSICLEEFGDAKVEEELGEVVRTSCGHHFHAVCIARHLESSENDPWCPNCRSAELAVYFPGHE